MPHYQSVGGAASAYGRPIFFRRYAHQMVIRKAQENLLNEPPVFTVKFGPVKGSNVSGSIHYRGSRLKRQLSVALP